MAIKFRKVFSSRQNIFAPVNRSPRLTVEFGVAFRGLPPLAACYGEPIKENFMSKWSEGHTFYFRPAEYRYKLGVPRDPRREAKSAILT
jgi:hypothetical protein